MGRMSSKFKVQSLKGGGAVKVQGLKFRVENWIPSVFTQLDQMESLRITDYSLLNTHY
jgi:hypothetical protein